MGCASSNLKLDDLAAQAHDHGYNRKKKKIRGDTDSQEAAPAPAEGEPTEGGAAAPADAAQGGEPRFAATGATPASVHDAVEKLSSNARAMASRGSVRGAAH